MQLVQLLLGLFVNIDVNEQRNNLILAEKGWAICKCVPDPLGNLNYLLRQLSAPPLSDGWYATCTGRHLWS